ncbi:type II-A CRISPR-associated protein Csn2 [Helcococcus ovis]|nr:type II-A CRISPR-associated protein Csn2 [Helcococcus ovis]TFF64244.1 type II-A CRISPR-associated protein Csn2 [Helcococcus ovis]TFF68272.1 type II-A CRISPR-associated protein Csn2 [Helcococcus ovis]WNZ00587.1 type II-A CRISPR-associated protein Csn2 [Helcococcus ovis]
MNLVYNLLNEPYLLDYGNFYNITIENLHEFRKVIEGIKNNEYINIYEEEKIINNFEFIENITTFNFEDKKIINKIIKDLFLLSKSEIFLDKYYQNNIMLKNFISDLIFEYEIPLEIDDEVDFTYILKSFGIKINNEYSSYIENLINYLKLYLEVFGVDIFIFINLTQFLSNEEFNLLFDFIMKNNILIINYDKIYMNNKIIKNQILFDNDLCRIL